MSKTFRTGPFGAGGATFVVDTNRSSLSASINSVLRDLRVAEPGPSPVTFAVLHRGTPPPSNPWGVWRDGEPCEMTVADFYVLPYLLWEITRLVFERTGDRVHLHGAALVQGGRAVLLAGASGAGKSTLALWLTHRGWGFLTDETALIDPASLLVSPFWRPIGVRRPGPLDLVLGPRPEGSISEQQLVPASSIGELAGTTPLGAMAFPVLVPGDPAAVERLTPAEALVELTRHFPGLAKGGRAGFRRLGRLADEVPAYVLRFSDLDDAERALRGVLVATA